MVEAITNIRLKKEICLSLLIFKNRPLMNTAWRKCILSMIISNKRRKLRVAEEEAAVAIAIKTNKSTNRDHASRVVVEDVVVTTTEKMMPITVMDTKTNKTMTSKIINHQEEVGKDVDPAITNAPTTNNIMAINPSSMMIVTTIKSKEAQVQAAKKIMPDTEIVDSIKKKAKRVIKIKAKNLIESVKLLKMKVAIDLKQLEIMLHVKIRKLLVQFLAQKLVNSNSSFSNSY